MRCYCFAVVVAVAGSNHFCCWTSTQQKVVAVAFVAAVALA
jgi:hypothetical protein